MTRRCSGKLVPRMKTWVFVSMALSCGGQGDVRSTIVFF